MKKDEKAQSYSELNFQHIQCWAFDVNDFANIIQIREKSERKIRLILVFPKVFIELKQLFVYFIIHIWLHTFESDENDL